MKVIALENGFFDGRPIEAGQTFDVQEGRKARWYKPAGDATKTDARPTRTPRAKAPDALSKVGTAEAKSFNDAMKSDAIA